MKPSLQVKIEMKINRVKADAEDIIVIVAIIVIEMEMINSKKAQTLFSVTM
jgi:hypothetical protein